MWRSPARRRIIRAVLAKVQSVRILQPADHGWVLALNAVHAQETSPLDAAALTALTDAALTALVIDPQAAFLIAFGPTAAYASPNYRWFQARGGAFAYVDRVVVAAHARGRGLARALYDATSAYARDSGLTAIGCEVNLDPPNPASDAFHAALGFEEVGRATLENGKTVRYLSRPLI